MTLANPLAASQRRSATLAGIGLMLAATLMFSLNDVLGKWLVATYSVSQILLLRSCAAMAVLAPFVWRGGRELFASAPRPRLQALRILFSTLEVACFYLAVSYLPLADAMTFYLAAPIYVTAMSALMLGEHVGIRRWTAVLFGFLGVVVALNPSLASLGVGSLVAVIGSFFFALFLVITRQLSGTSNTVLVTTQIGGALAFGAVGAPIGWTSLQPTDIPLFAILGTVSLGAFVLVNISLRLAPASVVVPFQYTLIVWALVFGYVFFGDVPQAHTVIGAVVIVASGLFIFLREQSKGGIDPGRRAPTAP
jgi:drug/metabolite transporter (DMT)-like permease